MPGARALNVAMPALLLSACGQEHLSIGSIYPEAEDASRTSTDDSGAELDARPPADRDAGERDAMWPVDVGDGGDLVVALRAFGYDDVSTIIGSCGDGCVDLELTARGGTPPYRFEWFDGYRGTRRQLCDTDGLAPPLGSVGKVSDARQDAPREQPVLANVVIEACDDAGTPADQLPWEFCYRPKLLVDPCPDLKGSWYAVESALPAGAYVSASLAVSGFLPATINVAFTDALCGTTTTSVTGQVWPFSGTAIHSDPISASGHLPFVRIFSPDSPSGQLPSWIGVAAMEICRPR